MKILGKWDHSSVLVVASTLRYTVLNLNGHLYIGGLPEDLRDETPPQAWSARLREDFVGCLGDLSIDGESVDLEQETEAPWAKEHVKPGEREPKQLDGKQENPCDPGERLRGSWSQPLCDCTQTNFTGSRCKEGWFYCDFSKNFNKGLKKCKCKKATLGNVSANLSATFLCQQIPSIFNILSHF